MDTAHSLLGRIGAYRTHATHDPRETTARAREAFLARFLEEVDPDHELAEAERHRRATAARKAYFAQLAYRSSAVRAKRGATSAKVTPLEVDDASRPPRRRAA
jgi:hypothetical protein